MPRGIFSIFLLLALLTALAACSPAPTPTPAPTRRPTRTPIPAATLKPPPTEIIPTATALPTNTTEPSPAPTQTQAAATTATAAPQNNAPTNGLTVWTMAPLIEYFKKIAPPAQDAITRPANVNPLTGLEVSDPALLQRRPVLARLGNDPSARAIHTGFNQADLVFEEMIDQKNMVFAVTRFTLVFLGQNGTFRPLRSARAINASLMPMFDGVLISSGGSKGTRFMFSQLPWKDHNLDGDLQNSTICIDGTDWRTRVLSSVEHVQEYIASKSQSGAPVLRGFQFSANAPGGAPANTIALDHKPWPVYAAGVIEWRYDAASGKYLRFVNGEPHNTKQYTLNGTWGKACQEGTATNEQIATSNVVILNVKYEPTDFVEDTLNSYSAFVNLVGSGTAQVYRDGVKTDARWERAALGDFIKLVDANGSEIALKPGNTWFELTPLNYQPTVK